MDFFFKSGNTWQRKLQSLPGENLEGILEKLRKEKDARNTLKRFGSHPLGKKKVSKMRPKEKA